MDSPTYARVLDTRLEAVSENRICYALKEGSAVTAFVPLVSSSHSNQNTTFNLNNIADFTARDSRLVIGLSVSATISFTNTTDASINVFQSDNFGFKQYPLNRCMNSTQHQINQASYTLQTADILDGIARINLLPSDCNFYENTMPDLIDNYSSATGANFNPLQPYSTTLAGDGVYKPRTLQYEVSGNGIVPPMGTASVTINATLYEPLVTPFTNISADDSRALYAITGELITIQWVTDLWNNMFAFVLPTGLKYTNTNSPAVVSLGNQANLFCIYLTPKEDTIAQIPRQSVYQYNDYSVFSNNIGSSTGVPAQTDVPNVNSQVVNFTNLPNYILIYARTANGSRLTSTPDKYLTIKNIQLTFDNGLPQLAGANTDQLYDISKRNMLTMPRACFKQLQLNTNNEVDGALYGCGSVLVISPALDLGIRPSDTTGSGGRYIFQVQNATFTNNTDTAFGQVTLYVVGINSAVLERVGSQYRNYLLTTPPDIINRIKDLPAVNYKQYMKSSHSNLFLMGGGISDWFKKAYSLGTRAYDLAMKHKDDLRQGLEAGKELYEVGKKLVGRGIDRGTRLFGENPRPNRNAGYFQ
jgi:hypothetical protein